MAFVHSLKKNGYAPDGTRLEGGQGNGDLFGTAQILAEQPMIKMDQEMVQEQTDKAVLKIIKLQREQVVARNKSKGSAGRAGQH
jgi:hypothetical protein